MRHFSHTVIEEDGIHARPAGLFVRLMNQYASIVTLVRGEDRADGRKLLAIMKLRVKYGETITVEVEGEDEDVAVEAARDFIEFNV
jgi:phosphotransferase system HPr (HPr) family protein